MMFQIAIWSILFSIGISDTKEHRIPNKSLLLLFFVSLLEWLVFSFSSDVLINKIGSGILMFMIGLLLFFLKAMSAGDVKLLGVVGFVIGLSQLQSVGYWVIVSAGIIGVFYAFYYSIESPKFGNKVRNDMTKLTIQQEALMLATQHTVMRKTVMPFAPAVVIGIAFHQYFL